MRVFEEAFVVDSRRIVSRIRENSDLKKALGLSLTAVYTTSRDPQKYAKHKRNNKMVADGVIDTWKRELIHMLSFTVAHPYISV